MIQVEISRFHYDKAQYYLDNVQAIIKHVDLLKYSLSDYQQIMMISTRHQILIDIATGQCEKAFNHIRKLDKYPQPEDLESSLIITKIHVTMIYALVCAKDEEQALSLDRQITSDLQQSVGYSYPSMSLDVAIFLAHYQQVKWAKHFAQRAIDAIPESQANVFYKLIDAAQAILDLEESESKP